MSSDGYHDVRLLVLDVLGVGEFNQKYMGPEGRFEFGDGLQLFSVSEEGLSERLDELAELKQELIKQEFLSQSPLKHVADSAGHEASRLAFGLDLGVAAYDAAIPVEGFSWHEEVERRRRAKYEGPQSQAPQIEKPAQEEAYPPEWVESHGRG